MFCYGQCSVQIKNKKYFIPNSQDLQSHNNYKLVIYDMNTKKFEFTTNYTSRIQQPAHSICLTYDNK